MLLHQNTPQRVALLSRVARLVHPVISQGGAPGAAAFRSAADRALAACGMHVAAAGHLHAMVCEAFAEYAAEAIEAHGADSMAARDAVQAACVAWEAWVAAPVAGGDDAMAGYQGWLQGLPEALTRPVPDRMTKVRPHPR